MNDMEESTKRSKNFSDDKSKNVKVFYFKQASFQAQSGAGRDDMQESRKSCKNVILTVINAESIVIQDQ